MSQEHCWSSSLVIWTPYPQLCGTGLAGKVTRTQVSTGDSQWGPATRQWRTKSKWISQNASLPVPCQGMTGRERWVGHTHNLRSRSEGQCHDPQTYSVSIWGMLQAQLKSCLFSPAVIEASLGGQVSHVSASILAVVTVWTKEAWWLLSVMVSEWQMYIHLLEILSPTHLCQWNQA